MPHGRPQAALGVQDGVEGDREREEERPERVRLRERLFLGGDQGVEVEYQSEESRRSDSSTVAIQEREQSSGQAHGQEREQD